MAHRLPNVCFTPPIPVDFDPRVLIATSPSRELAPIEQLAASMLGVTQLTDVSGLDWTEEIGLVLAAGAVSAAEEFFRELVIRSLAICPESRKVADALTTTIGAALGGSWSEIIHTSLQEFSFSSVKNLRDVSKTYIGFSWGHDSSLAAALDLYGKVCLLRHCAVHSGGLVNRRNAAVLGVASQSRVSLAGPGQVLSLVHVVTCAARTFNAELFRFLVERWINQRVLTGDAVQDRPQFDALWQVFAATSDRPVAQVAGVQIPRNCYDAYRVIRPILVARAGG